MRRRDLEWERHRRVTLRRVDGHFKGVATPSYGNNLVAIENDVCNRLVLVGLKCHHDIEPLFVSHSVSLLAQTP